VEEEAEEKEGEDEEETEEEVGKVGERRRHRNVCSQ